MTNSVKAVTLGIAGAFAAVAGLLIATLVMKPSGPPVLKAGTLLEKPRELPDFALSDTTGAPFGKDRLSGKWSVLFVGFTNCPDVCPNTMGVLKTVHAKLVEEQRPLQVVFLSVDPERDTHESLDRYVHYFDPSFVGVTGATAELDKVAAAMGFVYAKVPMPQSYTIEHWSGLILVNPQAQVAGYFSAPVQPAALTADLVNLIPKA
ncbi:MAG TPA: SCO family protein [Nevskiaceae bacterium]|nr:SCO family protein [Nevskiaceae bacterium]